MIFLCLSNKRFHGLHPHFQSQQQSHWPSSFHRRGASDQMEINWRAGLDLASYGIDNNKPKNTSFMPRLSRGKLSPNCPHFEAEIADFDSNYCILRKNPKRNI